MSDTTSTDFFERARAISASVLFAAGAAAVIGAVLDWVTAGEVPPTVPKEQADRLPPFTGLELGHGWVVIGAAVVIVLAAFWIVLRNARGAAWLAFLGSIIIGGISMADYRDLDALLRDIDAIGRDPQVGVGLTLTVVAAIVGVIAAVGALAATPRET